MDFTEDDMLSAFLPRDWMTDGMEGLICPCGHDVEQDGMCPDGCVSPLLTMGLI